MMAGAASVAGASPDAQTPPPLDGRRILITRSPHQASELATRLRALGASPILIPTIEIAPPASYAALDQTLAALDTFDLVAFTSANAVEAFHRRAQDLGTTPLPRRIAAVGPATARAIASIGLHADVLPPTYTAAALAHTLSPAARGQRILLVLAEDAPPTLATALEAAGASITIAHAYGTRIPESSISALTSLFDDPASYPDAITFTSESTVRNLLSLLQSAGLELPDAILRASIGPITSRTLTEAGYAPHVEATESTIAALEAALVKVFAEQFREKTEGRSGTVIP